MIAIHLAAICYCKINKAALRCKIQMINAKTTKAITWKLEYFECGRRAIACITYGFCSVCELAFPSSVQRCRFSLCWLSFWVYGLIVPKTDYAIDDVLLAKRRALTFDLWHIFQAFLFDIKAFHLFTRCYFPRIWCLRKWFARAVDKRAVIPRQMQERNHEAMGQYEFSAQ